jgi:hypothetical protein
MDALYALFLTAFTAGFGLAIGAITAQRVYRGLDALARKAYR